MIELNYTIIIQLLYTKNIIFYLYNLIFEIEVEILLFH